MPPLWCSPVRSKACLRVMSFWSPNPMTFSMSNHRQINLSCLISSLNTLFSLSMYGLQRVWLSDPLSVYQNKAIIKHTGLWQVLLICYSLSSPRSVAELLGQPVSVCYWTGGWVLQVAMAGGLQTRVNDWMWERGKTREAPGRPDEGKARTGPWFPMEAQQRLLFKIK